MIINNSLVKWALERVIETSAKKTIGTDISVNLNDIQIKSEGGTTKLNVNASVEGADATIMEFVSRKLQAL